MRFNKTLTAVATAAALVTGVAIAQNDPVQPAPNTTGQPGAALGNQSGTMNSGSTMSNSPSTGSTVDSSAPAASSDIATPEPRADRN